MDLSERVDRHFLRQALEWSSMSNDPNTRVGAVIISTEGEPLSGGYNQFPRGIAETHERLGDRTLKNKIMVHAERDAIINAARTGVSIKGSILYLACTDDSGLIWGGPPCTFCTCEILHAGITRIVSYRLKPVSSNWHTDLAFARELIAEKGISYTEYVPQNEQPPGNLAAKVQEAVHV